VRSSSDAQVVVLVLREGAVAGGSGRLSPVLQSARETQDVPTRVVMSSAGKRRTATFEQSLIDHGAKSSFDTLVGKALTPQLLESWLRDIATASDTYGTRREDKREAAQLARRAKSLAKEIEYAAKAPPVFFMGAPTELLAMRALEQMLLEPLRKYATCWENVISWENRISGRRPRGPRSPRTDRIAALLEIVDECTGTYHYREVADVLNVMDSVSGRSDGSHWTEENLTQLQHRARNRMAKVRKD
jgi:hypothetical protein